jgi:hypothetical protein
VVAVGDGALGFWAHEHKRRGARRS